MLPAENRLNLSFFRNDRKKTKKVFSRYFVFEFQKEPNIFKVAALVTKKVAPKATDRNRIKRTVTEAVKNNKDLEGNLKIVVLKNISDLKTSQIQELLGQLLIKLK